MNRGDRLTFATNLGMQLLRFHAQELYPDDVQEQKDFIRECLQAMQDTLDHH